MASKIVAHSFKARDGRRYRIVDDPGSRLSPTFLEHNGVFVEPCHTTGPEILKLAAQGRDLWNGLNKLANLIAIREGVDIDDLRRLDTGVAEALALLESTAATFDHNKPEVDEPKPEGGA